MNVIYNVYLLLFLDLVLHKGTLYSISTICHWYNIQMQPTPAPGQVAPLTIRYIFRGVIEAYFFMLQ